MSNDDLGMWVGVFILCCATVMCMVLGCVMVYWLWILLAKFVGSLVGAFVGAFVYGYHLLN